METIINAFPLPNKNQFSRNIIFSILGKLTDGGLTIEDDSGKIFFGDNNSDLQAKIQVHNNRMYHRLLFGGSIGIAESYVEKEWDSDQLVNVIRLFARNLVTLEKLEKRLGWITYPVHKIRHLLNRNTPNGSRTNIAAHYDLGNELYQLILDEHMQYSSAIFPHMSDDLSIAQQNKLQTICNNLELNENDHLLEIGTGWGGLACYAAKHYGCKVTTTTLSQQQYDYALQQIKHQGLSDKITLLLKDYRELEGQYNKLVSVEMIEAVGHEYLPQFFKQLEKLLLPQGQMLIQSITIADQLYGQYRKGVDFIQKYIFPGGCLPSISEMTRHIKNHTTMNITAVNDYGLHYAQTLAHWTDKFQLHSKQLESLGYKQDFQRLWNFYFAYCEGGFREKNIGLVLLQATKRGA